MVKSLIGWALLASLLMASGASAGDVILRIKKPNGTAATGLKVVIGEVKEQHGQHPQIDSGITDKNGEVSTKLILAGTACVHVDIYVKVTPPGKTEAEWTPLCRDNLNVQPVIEVTATKHTQLDNSMPRYVIACVPKQTPCGLCWCREIREVDASGNLLSPDAKNAEPPPDEQDAHKAADSGSDLLGQRLFESKCPLVTVPEPDLLPPQAPIRSAGSGTFVARIGAYLPSDPKRIRPLFAGEAPPRPMPIASDDHNR
jgi:hypothetical protein